jgi:ABC-type antimicrobial peptide transport system permease subunit
VPEIRDAVRAVNPNLALANVGTLADLVDRSMARTSFTMAMLLIASSVALALGLVGIYGTVSYVVSQRSREFGVRIAVGADGRDVRRMVLRHALVLAGLGVGLGVVAARGLAGPMASLLYGVDATDPLTYGVVAAALTAVALLASYLPAWRASRTDPVVALRSE